MTASVATMGPCLPELFRAGSKVRRAANRVLRSELLILARPEIQRHLSGVQRRQISSDLHGLRESVHTAKAIADVLLAPPEAMKELMPGLDFVKLQDCYAQASRNVMHYLDCLTKRVVRLVIDTAPPRVRARQDLIAGPAPGPEPAPRVECLPLPAQIDSVAVERAPRAPSLSVHIANAWTGDAVA